MEVVLIVILQQKQEIGDNARNHKKRSKTSDGFEIRVM